MSDSISISPDVEKRSRGRPVVCPLTCSECGRKTSRVYRKIPVTELTDEQRVARNEKARLAAQRRRVALKAEESGDAPVGAWRKYQLPGPVRRAKITPPEAK